MNIDETDENDKKLLAITRYNQMQRKKENLARALRRTKPFVHVFGVGVGFVFVFMLVSYVRVPN